jgi:hypothetical protein
MKIAPSLQDLSTCNVSIFAVNFVCGTEIASAINRGESYRLKDKRLAGIMARHVKSKNGKGEAE